MATLIGLSGWAGSGKDTAAEYLIDEKGYTRVAFADPLREALLRLNPIVSNDIDGMYFTLSQMVHFHGWEGAKRYSTNVRELLQRMGTEVGRQMISPTIWVDLAMRESAKHELVVITDVRFPNEADAIKAAGGVLWRIQRPYVSPANSHSSETALDDYKFDAVVENNGSIEDLHAKLQLLLEAKSARIKGNNE